MQQTLSGESVAGRQVLWLMTRSAIEGVIDWWWLSLSAACNEQCQLKFSFGDLPMQA